MSIDGFDNDINKWIIIFVDEDWGSGDFLGNFLGFSTLLKTR